MSADTYKKPGESSFGFVLLIFSLFIFYQAYKISGFTALSSPGAFPLVTSGLMCLSACFTIFSNYKRKAKTEGMFFDEIVPGYLAVAIVLLFIFSVVLETLGFILTAFFFLVIMTLLFYKRGLVRSVFLSLLSIAIIYIIFRLLFQVILPEGIVPEREILAWIESLFSTGGE